MENEYIIKLIHRGFSPCNAYLIYHDFMRKYAFSHKELDEFLESFEKDYTLQRVPLCG